MFLFSKLIPTSPEATGRLHGIIYRCCTMSTPARGRLARPIVVASAGELHPALQSCT